MVNAGALATTALLPGKSPDQKWQHLLAGLSAFAGRELSVDEEVYESEAASNSRNKALAMLLQNYDRLTSDPLEIVDVYTRQCAITVTATDLAGGCSRSGYQPNQESPEES